MARLPPPAIPTALASALQACGEEGQRRLGVAGPSGVARNRVFIFVAGRLVALAVTHLVAQVGGEASIGTRLSTVPSEGRNQDSELLAKPRSSNCAAFTARARPDDAPSTTAISRLPLRVADATKL